MLKITLKICFAYICIKWYHKINYENVQIIIFYSYNLVVVPYYGTTSYHRLFTKLSIIFIVEYISQTICFDYSKTIKKKIVPQAGVKSLYV